jgi:hypothetical protein
MGGEYLQEISVIPIKEILNGRMLTIIVMVIKLTVFSLTVTAVVTAVLLLSTIAIPLLILFTLIILYHLGCLIINQGGVYEIMNFFIFNCRVSSFHIHTFFQNFPYNNDYKDSSNFQITHIHPFGIIANINKIIY